MTTSARHLATHVSSLIQLTQLPECPSMCVYRCAFGSLCISASGDKACCKGKCLMYSLCLCAYIYIKTQGLMPPLIKSISLSSNAYHNTTDLHTCLYTKTSFGQNTFTMVLLLFQVTAIAFVLFWANKNRIYCEPLSKVSAHTHMEKPWSPVKQQNAGFGYCCSTN